VLLGNVTDVDVTTRHLRLDDGASIPYDTLIVAAGAQNSYFGNDAWEEYAPGLKTVEEATHIRQKIFYAFEAAEREHDPDARRSWLTFVVVGAGATGVELAGALGEIANDTLKGDFCFIRPEEARILLVEGTSRVLPPFPPDLSEKAERSLIDLGVRTRTNVIVTNIDPGGVTIQGPNGAEHINARTVLWAAGVRGVPLGRVLADRTGAEIDRGGRILVANDCSIPGHSNIFVIGDLSNFKDEKGESLPGVAPTAMQQGRYVARLIQARLAGGTMKPFHYFDKGTLAVIGRASGVAKLGRFHFGGHVAWLLWLFVHLMYLVTFQNRIVVFIRWGFEYITFNRGARLITNRDV
jgi:NADH dehydrogenase